MGKYIDADALIAKMPTVMDMQDTYLPIHFKEWLIDTAPSIDIVFCKECKWRGEQTESGIPYYWCRLVGVGYEVPIEHYCSYGERREP